MTEEAKEARREYTRQYRAEHRDQIRANYRAWYHRNQESEKRRKELFWEKRAKEKSNSPLYVPRGEEPTLEQIQQARETNDTQGRKGMKALRVNMAFAPDVYTYIRTMSKHLGITITEFTNRTFRQSMMNNGDLYEDIKKRNDGFKF